MNEIIGELSNIEESTSGIIEAANAKKKELAAQMDQKTKLWDKELAEQTQQKIQKLRTEMQNTISKNLAEQKAKSEAKQTPEVKESKKELTQVLSEAEVTNKLAETELAKADVKEELYANGALYAQMSGSGSTIFGIFGQKPANIKEFFPGMFTYCVRL